MDRRATGVIVGIFIVLLVVLFWQNAREKVETEEAAAPTPEQTFLLDQGVKITELRIEGAGGQVVELQQAGEGAWELILPEANETDISAVETTLSQLAALRVLSTLNKAPELDVIGLKSATKTILVGFEDGEQVVIHVGDSTPTDSGYYVLVSGRPIAVVDKYGLDSILGLLEAPPIKPTATPESGFIPAGSTRPLALETSILGIA